MATKALADLLVRAEKAFASFLHEILHLTELRHFNRS